MASISRLLTVRDAPFKLCAARKIASRELVLVSCVEAFSNSTNPDAMAWICSRASARNVASNRFRNFSSVPDMGRYTSHFVLIDQTPEFLAQVVQVARGCLSLLCSGGVLHAGLLDALHGCGDLVGSDQLLLAGSGDLRCRLGCLGGNVSQKLDRVAA